MTERPSLLDLCGRGLLRLGDLFVFTVVGLCICAWLGLAWLFESKQEGAE